VKTIVVKMSIKCRSPLILSLIAGNVERNISRVLMIIREIIVQSTILSTLLFFSSSNAAAITTVSVIGGVAAVWVLGKYVVPELIDTHSVTYKVDGKIYKTYLVKTGDAIEIPADPSKDGMIFAGWEPEVPEVMPDHDLVFEATWEEESIIDTIIPQTGSATSKAISVSVTAGLALAVIAIFKKKKED
jgi:LPXTG-motif cell wall-anchored protein